MPTLDLPDTAALDDPGHVSDHNKIVTAITTINTEGTSATMATASTWKWLSASQAGSVSTGRIGVNNDSPASATAIHMAASDNDGFDRTGFVTNLKAGDTVFIWDKADTGSNVRYTVTGAPTNNTTWFSVPVQAVAGAGTEPGNNNLVVAAFLYASASIVPYGGTTPGTGVTAFPGALDDFATTSPTNLGDDDSTGRTHVERHNDTEAAIEAVQAELGTDPAGAQATVKARLDEHARAMVTDVLWTSGTYACNALGTTITGAQTITSVANRVLYFPWWCPNSATLDRIAVEVTTLFAGANATLGLYGTTTDLMPGSLIANFGEIDCASAAVKELTISQAVVGGRLYWLCCHQETGTVVYKGNTPSSGVSLSAAATGSPARQLVLYETVAYSSSAMPADASGSLTRGASTVYQITFWMRRA
jgi:hypothetical protein